MLQLYSFKNWFGCCTCQTFTTKGNTQVQKLLDESINKPPSPTQMHNGLLHLQSLVRGKSRVYDQFPFDNSSELGVFFKDGFHVQYCPGEPNLQGQQVRVSGMSSSLRPNHPDILQMHISSTRYLNQQIFMVPEISRVLTPITVLVADTNLEKTNH